MRRNGVSRVLGVHTTWTTVGDGEFFCPGCGGDRNFQRRTGRRRFTVLGMPVVPRGETGPVVQCAACEEQFGTDALDHPTTHRFSAMLRDAVHTVVLAVLAAGGSSSRQALESAVGTLRGAGFDDCSEEQLAALVEALMTDAGRLPEHCGAGAGLAIELHEALDPLAPHLAPAGRESILLQGARIALADGPYSASERDVLGTVGAALTMCTDEVNQLLVAAARTPS
ncbi:TerB family tellurite resistance protein [Streptomyces sp. SID14478]|uniref:tellurite resistance TerB family protein n=1 Tax=Streptomyces sp. SID14478 TaxID=2706073 RepID=UPI0013E04844|nr:TerB family tellurite resistance protein [Streptomyces sp. SID14478]NEB81000.1 TerB family tellurite resistance protein [Streptomyces sp. SID14478]